MMKKVFGALKAVWSFLKAAGGKLIKLAGMHKKVTFAVIAIIGALVAGGAIRSTTRNNTIAKNTNMHTTTTTAEEDEIATDVEDVSLFEEEQEEEQETTTTVTTVLPEEIIPTTTKAATTTAAIVGRGTTGTNTITTATTTTTVTTTASTTTPTVTEEETTTTTITAVTIDKDEATIRLTYGEIQGMIMENFEDWYNHEIWIKGGICYLDTYVMVVSDSDKIGSFVQTSVGNGIVVGSSEKPGYAVLMTDDMG